MVMFVFWDFFSEINVFWKIHFIFQHNYKLLEFVQKMISIDKNSQIFTKEF
jgi:hypothetical protein